LSTGLADLQLNDRLIRFVEGGKVMEPPQSILSSSIGVSGDSNAQAKCSSVKEGDIVNVHVTALGAMMALALIHLKSNNSQIAERLELPQSFYALEFARPT
jgi:anaphase-promoting complex subunit 1